MDAYERGSQENAAIALMRAGNYRGAEARLRTVLAQDPNDARALALLAQCRLEDKDKKQGLAIARSAAELAPDDPLVKSTLTFALQRAGKGKAAREEQLRLAEDTASERPEDSDALFDLVIARQNSNAFRKARGRAELDQMVAMRDLMDDAERFAGEAHELLNIAGVRLRQWDYPAAQSLAQRAMQLDPTRPQSFRILAECAIAQKHPADAYELALEALRLSPGDPYTMRLLVRARARSRLWLRPFIPLVDWIVEMDRSGLVVVPLLTCVLGFIFMISLAFDLERIEAGVAPALILSVASGVAIITTLVSYFTAIFARMQIRRDLRRISLPRF